MILLQEELEESLQNLRIMAAAAVSECDLQLCD
jgi:hypothetical protein